MMRFQPILYFMFLKYKNMILKKKELTKLSRNYVKECDLYNNLFYFSYFVNNNYLFVRYGLKVEVYNKEAELIYNFIYEQFGENDLPIAEFYCNNKTNIFIGKNSKNKIKMFIYKNNNFQELNTFYFDKKDTRGIIKTKDNNFIIYSWNKITFIKNFNK